MIILGRQKTTITECVMEECTNKVKARGLCHKHYKELSLNNICKIEDCQNKTHAHGLCSKHYEREFKDTLRSNEKDICHIDNCLEQSIAKGLCRKHYNQEYSRKY